MDNKACKLEAEHEVKARIARLKRLAAEKATTTRAEVLAGISYTFQAGIARVGGAGDGRQLDYTSVNAVTQLGKTLLDALPKEGGCSYSFVNWEMLSVRPNRGMLTPSH